MQRIFTILGVCGALVFGAGCSHTGSGCSTGGCATGGCSTCGGSGHAGGLFGFGGCQHVGGKCDCVPDSVQGTCNYYAAAGNGTNVQAAPAPAAAAPAGTYEAIPAPKSMPKGDGK